MEYQIALPLSRTELDTLRSRTQVLDASAVLDYDVHTGRLRLSTVLLAVEVMFLLHERGHPVSLAQVHVVPSVCCGGCSG